MLFLILSFLPLLVGCFGSSPVVPTYTLTSLSPKHSEGVLAGYTGIYTLTSAKALHGPDAECLYLDISFLSCSTVRARVWNPSPFNSTHDEYVINNWRVPEELLENSGAEELGFVRNSEIEFPVVGEPVQSSHFVIRRKCDKRVIFNATDLIWESMYRSIDNAIRYTEAHEPNLYGLGDRVFPLRLQVPNFYPLWNRARHLYYVNIYSSHPVLFHIDPETDKADGVFLFNSNAMGVDVRKDGGELSWRVQYKVTGGILDFFVFVGDEDESARPERIVGLYHEVIGKPKLIPKWSLGWHQSRYGYPNVSYVWDVVRKYEELEIPLECIWNDIDYMDGSKDFTLDPARFPLPEVQKFVDYVHKKNKKYVVILDPFFKLEKGYAPYDRLIQSGAFVRRCDGKTPIVNKARPGYCVYPDWSNPAMLGVWTELIRDFRNKIGLDGIWIDMNEPQAYCDRECYPSSAHVDTDDVSSSCSGSGSKIGPENPPWTPTGGYLDDGSLSMNARLNASIMFNAHQLYGRLEAEMTSVALERTNPGGSKWRSFVLSRSTFPGAGHFASHWTGDNIAMWESLKLSIPTILNTQLSGVTHTGADVCGFALDTDPELCARWTLLSIFYPFARNHNEKGFRPQEPWALGLTKLVRDAMNMRYSLIQFFYTDFVRISLEGGLFWKSLAFEYPSEPIVAGVDTQFLVADSLLVSPVTEFVENTAALFTFRGYFPEGRWFDFYDPKSWFRSTGEWKDVSTPIDKIPVHFRGGHIVSIQKPALTTIDMELNEFRLVVPLDDTGSATGHLYFDDGVSLDSLALKKYTRVSFDAKTDRQERVPHAVVVTSTVVASGYPFVANVVVSKVTVAGIAMESVSECWVDGVRHDSFEFDAPSGTANVTNLSLKIGTAFKIVLD